MLPKIHRLRLKNDFDRIFKQGKFVSQRFFTLCFTANNLSVSRFGLVVPKKVSKSAVVRNSIKRKVSEIIRLNLAGIRTGFDLVFVAKPESKGKKYEELAEEMLKIMKRAGLIA